MSKAITRFLGIALLFGLALSTASVAAETRYVSDELEITLRNGPGTQYKILRMLKSGTPVDVLEAGDGYVRVREPGGREGWVLTRFLMNQPSARARIEENQRQMAAMQEEMTAARDQLQHMQQLQDELTSTQTENARLQSELDNIRRIAADSLSLNQQNQSLQESLSEFKHKLETLQGENARLKDASAQDWFLRGAGVVLLGILIGLIIPKIRWQKRRSWGDI